jgi:hypothetical protein
MLSKIVQESVESFNLKPKEWYLNQDTGKYEMTDDIYKKYLISSQISLLEAELERKKGIALGLTGEYNDEKGVYAMCLLEILEQDITYLTEQIELCRKLI